MEEIAPARQTQGPIAGTGRNVIGQSSKERVLWTFGRPRMPIRQPLQRTEVWAGLGRPAGLSTESLRSPQPNGNPEKTCFNPLRMDQPN